MLNTWLCGPLSGNDVSRRCRADPVTPYGDQEAAVAIYYAFYYALGFVLEPNSHLIEYRRILGVENLV